MQLSSVSQGGWLTLNLPDASQGSAKDLELVRGLWVSSDAGQMAVAELVPKLGVELVGPGSLRFRARLEPGIYSLCVTEQECERGRLAPNGELLLHGANLPLLKNLFAREPNP